MILVVLINEILKLIETFISFWYKDIPKHFWQNFLELFDGLERKFAVRITLENIFVPLWQDYSLLGRIISFPIRISKILIGILIYLAFFSVSFVIFISIEALPIILIYLSL